MKKLFTSLALFAGLSIGAFAQNCQTGPETTIAPGSGTTPGLHPTSDSLPCSVRGTQVVDTIYFTNFQMFSGFQVQSLRIDSIGNLPFGTCWQSNKANNTFGPGENGVIYVHGLNTAAPGQYKLKILITAQVQTIGTIGPDADAETLAKLRYYVRVINNAGCPCPAVDTVLGKTMSFIPYTTPACTVGITEVGSSLNNVSVVPNPFNSTANVSFNSEVEGTFAVKMTNLLGAVVSSKEVAVSRGRNETSIERNGMASGIYIMSISNGSSSITKKVVIE
jgi:hypothetical protein